MMVTIAIVWLALGLLLVLACENAKPDDEHYPPGTAWRVLLLWPLLLLMLIFKGGE